MTPPRRHADWSAIVDCLNQLQAARRRDWPDLVDRRRMKPEQAEQRYAALRGVIGLFRDIMGGQPLVQERDYQRVYGASIDDMRAETLAVLRGAIQRALGTGDAWWTDAADLIEALDWLLAPADGASAPNRLRSQIAAAVDNTNEQRARWREGQAKTMEAFR